MHVRHSRAEASCKADQWSVWRGSAASRRPGPVLHEAEVALLQNPQQYIAAVVAVYSCSHQQAEAVVVEYRWRPEAMSSPVRQVAAMWSQLFPHCQLPLEINVIKGYMEA